MGSRVDNKKAVKELLEWLKYIVGAIAFAFIFNNTVIVNANVVSGSMESTIMTDSRVLGSRLTYDVSEPKRTQQEITGHFSYQTTAILF